MLHLGIDQHKKYSQVHAINDKGEVIFQGKINNSKEEFISLRKRFDDKEKVQSVIEASRTWIIYDLLEELNFNPKIANPVKTKAIAEAQVKTDSIDARTLAYLLKSDLIPQVHIADRETRRIKNILRQRLWLVKFQTSLKNRIHHILDRNHLTRSNVELTDIFGQKGREWIEKAKKELPDTEKLLLKESLDLLDVVIDHVKGLNKLLKSNLKLEKETELCKSLPGIGDTFGAIIALEIWGINRFPTKKKLVGYAGLAPTTYSSGGKTFHGKLFWQCNKLLKYAFCEGAWAAIKTSPYFRSYYQRLKGRVGSQKAIIGVAKKLCEMTWYCLKEQRPYEERIYKRRDLDLKVCQTH